METQTVKAGIIMKDGKPIACILSDDKTRVPTIYSLEKLGFDEVIDLFDTNQKMLVRPSVFKEEVNMEVSSI